MALARVFMKDASRKEVVAILRSCEWWQGDADKTINKHISRMHSVMDNIFVHTRMEQRRIWRMHGAQVPSLRKRLGSRRPMNAHLVLVEKEAGGLACWIDDEGEPLTEPLQHHRILEAQVVRGQAHPLRAPQQRTKPSPSHKVSTSKQPDNDKIGLECVVSCVFPNCSRERLDLPF